MIYIIFCSVKCIFRETLTEQTALKTKTFVSSLSSWSATPQFNHDANASLGGGIHSLKVKESIRNTYVETKNALQQLSAGTNFEGGTSIERDRTDGYVPQASTSNPEDQQGEMPCFPDGTGSLPVADCFEPQDDSTPPFDKPPDSEVRAPAMTSYHVESPSASHTGMSSHVKERAHMDMGTETSEKPGMPSEESLDQESRSVLLYQGQDMSQPDWETSFALVSTTRPTPPGNMAEPGYSVTDGRAQVQPAFESGGGGMVQTTGEGSYRMILDDDPNAVDSIHVEIQRLQARIMSRLRDTAAPPDLSFSGLCINPCNVRNLSPLSLIVVFM